MKLFFIALALISLSAAVFGQFASSQISGVQNLGDGSGYVWTSTSLFRTDNDGATWTEISLHKLRTQTIAYAGMSKTDGFVLLADVPSSTLEIKLTRDGSESFTSIAVSIAPEQLQDADLTHAWLSRAGEWQLIIPLETSSNFHGNVSFVSDDDLRTWKLARRTVRANTPLDELSSDTIFGNWTLRQSGTCYGSKTGCVEETRLFAGEREITPPQIRAIAETEKQYAMAEADANRMFAMPPGGSTRISLNKGFDKCTAFSTAQAQVWWNSSPYYDVNIYMSGRNRACPNQPFNGNPAWLDQVTAMGWGLIPTVVGYQSPCTSSATTVKLSYDVALAEQQGRGEADIAVADANAIGITTGSILYYDMERYDPPTGDPLGCEPATRAFLKGWTDRIHELGFISGVYGSPFNAQNHWVNLPQASKPDVVWMARWDNLPTVWTFVSFPNFPTNEWTNHQRIKQYFNGNDTWGGVTFNIDKDISDAPVAAPAIPKNKVADFDGDGKTDISVWRPDTGVWYAFQSSNSTPTAVQFGYPTDVLAPGDYDGDGKTDQAVFRPSDGTWHILTKAGFYSSRVFGQAGDIPAPADFNGDRLTDIAVFRPADGVWYVANSDSQGTISFIQFGSAGDKPVAADYDNDGRADVAVYRLNNGAQEWWVQRTTAGLLATSFGAAGDLAVQSDYTGDGKTDIAVFRPSTGTWYVLRSEDLSYFAFPFGTTGDVPAPGDYDGDNIFDAAVFRPSTGVWYAQLSTGGYAIVQFGQAGDHPVPNAYLPQ